VLLYVPPHLTFRNSTFCPHSAFMCSEHISEQGSSYFPIQHYVIGFYNLDGSCLSCGTRWTFIYDWGRYRCLNCYNKEQN